MVVTRKTSALLGFHLQPLAQTVKSYIKDTNGFLNKLRSLPKLPDNIVLCTVDVVDLYPIIPHEEGLSALRKRLANQMEKYISSDTLCDLAEVVLKNNIFKFARKTLKQKRGTAIGMKFALFCLWQNWKGKFFEKQNLNRIYDEGILMIYFIYIEVLYR